MLAIARHSCECLATVLHPLNVISTQSLPTTQKTNKSSKAESSRRDGENSLQTSNISINDDGDLLRGERRANLSRACRQGKCWVELWQALDEVLDELVVEATLIGGNEEGAADS